MNRNVRTALIIGGIAIALLIAVPFILGTASGWQSGGWGMMGHGMMGGYSGMWLMPIFWILIIGLVIWAIVALVRGLSQPSGSNSSSTRPDSALEILKSRYAKGEIGKEEYDEKRKDLI